jgi:L-2-hydroxyglutarate oxidase LhgO
LRKLSDQELDEISELAAQSAENFIYSKVSKKEVTDLDIKITLDYHTGLDVDIIIDIQFDPLSRADKNIADEAAAHAIEEIDKYLAEN